MSNNNNNNNFLDIVNEMMNALFDFKEKISDSEYKSQLENLSELRKIHIDLLQPSASIPGIPNSATLSITRRDGSTFIIANMPNPAEDQTDSEYEGDSDIE